MAEYMLRCLDLTCFIRLLAISQLNTEEVVQYDIFDTVGIEFYFGIVIRNMANDILRPFLGIDSKTK